MQILEIPSLREQVGTLKPEKDLVETSRSTGRSCDVDDDKCIRKSPTKGIGNPIRLQAKKIRSSTNAKIQVENSKTLFRSKSPQRLSFSKYFTSCYRR